MDAHDYLAAARELIADAHRWRTGILAADRYGDPVSPLGPASGYCLHGALIHVTGREDWMNADPGLSAVLHVTAREMFPQYDHYPDILGAVNNGPGHAAVLALLGACLRTTGPKFLLYV